VTLRSAARETHGASLRGTRGFRSFWLSRAISSLGSAITMVALPVLIYQLTGSPVLVSLVAAAEAIPYLALGLLAGALADRVDRRRLMITADLLNAVCLGSIPLAAALGVLTAAQIIAAALVSSTLSMLFDSGVYGLLPEIVGRDKIAAANSAIYGTEAVVRIAGTAAAGGLIALLGPARTLATDATSFLVSGVLITTIGRRAAAAAVGERPPLRKAVAEGLRFLFGHPMLRLMTIAGTLQSISGGAIIGQLVVFADRALGIHGSDPRIGLLYAAWSAGGIGGSLLLPRLLRRFDAFQILAVALLAGAALGLVVVLSSDWLIALAAIAAWGTAYLVVLVNTMSYSQEVTPPDLQSRVNTTRRTLSSGLGVPLGALLASILTVQFGIRVGMSTAVVSIATAAVIVWSARLRHRS
jgi:MFS family permease